MYVYITQARKTGLHRVTEDGMPLWHLAVGHGYIAKRIAAQRIRQLHASGVRHCICQDSALAALAEKSNITPVPVLPLRQALLDALLSTCFPGDLQNSTVRICAPTASEPFITNVFEVLAHRARYLFLEIPDSGQLERLLLYRWGISTPPNDKHFNFTVVLGQGVQETIKPPVLYLTGDCAARQRLVWTSPRLKNLSLPPTEQLAAALLSAGKWQPCDIQITSLLDISPESHYNAT